MKFRRVFFPSKPKPEEPKPAPVPAEAPEMPVSINMYELARQIVANPAFENVVLKLRQDQIRHFVSTAPDQAAVREQCYERLSAIEAIVGALVTMSKIKPSEKPRMKS